VPPWRRFFFIVESWTLSATHIAHIDQPWAFVFVHTWHAIFHTTHVTIPPPRLVPTCNSALTNAYIRWEQQNADEPLRPAPITIDGIAMTAMRHYNAPPHIKPLLQMFERQFKQVVSIKLRVHQSFCVWW
jgi:hypothetical protein